MGAIAVLRVPLERLYLFKRSQIYVYKGLKGNLFALKISIGYRQFGIFGEFSYKCLEYYQISELKQDAWSKLMALSMGVCESFQI